MHRQTKTMGYGVMVTLQILVLSFLVRIQVAQLNDSLWGSFFLCGWRWAWLVVARCVIAIGATSAMMRASAEVASTAQQKLSHQPQHISPRDCLWLFFLILTCGWLSRYDNDLLLDLWSALIFIRYRLYFVFCLRLNISVRIQVAQLNDSLWGSFFYWQLSILRLQEKFSPLAL